MQYACGDYTEILAAHAIQASMSRIGNPYDNAKAESFMKTLKQEEVDGRNYRDADHARSAIGTFIEEVYNRQRCTRRWPTARRPSSKPSTRPLPPRWLPAGVYKACGNLR